MLHNGAVTLVAKKESKKWTVANVGNHSREKETHRETETETEAGEKGREREIDTGRGKETAKKRETERPTQKASLPMKKKKCIKE